MWTILAHIGARARRKAWQHERKRKICFEGVQQQRRVRNYGKVLEIWQKKIFESFFQRKAEEWETENGNNLVIMQISVSFTTSLILFVLAIHSDAPSSWIDNRAAVTVGKSIKLLLSLFSQQLKWAQSNMNKIKSSQQWWKWEGISWLNVYFLSHFSLLIVEMKVWEFLKKSEIM